MEQSRNILIGSTMGILILMLCSLKNNVGWWNDDDEALVSLCQVHVQSDEFNAFDDRTLLALLATFKMNDFQIGQPVWGSSNTLIYLCEHRLKSGLKQSRIDQELNDILKNSGESSKRFTWSCA